MGDSAVFKKLADYLEARRELEGGLYLPGEMVQQLKLAAERCESLEGYGQRISGCVKCP